MTSVPGREKPQTPPARRAVDDAVDARDVVWAHRFEVASRVRRVVVVIVVAVVAGRYAWRALSDRGCLVAREERLAALQAALSARTPLPEGTLLPAPTPAAQSQRTTQILALSDGAAVVVDGVIVGGGPLCHRR